MRPTKVLIAKSRYDLLWSREYVTPRCRGWILLIGLLSVASV